MKAPSEDSSGSGHLFKERDNFTTIEAYKVKEWGREEGSGFKFFFVVFAKNLFSAYEKLTRGAEANNQ